ncbi:hypothetical protein [Streptomyces sp. MST-110588]|uniref:hypothetical protein n=1 Tax=Streptomyces sp. MST-110588 TaxID=2833628 RepID=UPI001F5CE2AA|nr:hypothetical protein [Streptomyces sp. MST-110588]UNO40041.1 hypothetical protein KGS77_11115 [Streptomyces sp. MST-110588]
MISSMKNKLAGSSVIATCPLGFSLLGTGLSVAGRLSGIEGGRMARLAILPISERVERPTQAPAVAAVAAETHVFAAAAANGAGSPKQYQAQKHQHDQWAHRGHEPWRDPA